MNKDSIQYRKKSIYYMNLIAIFFMGMLLFRTAKFSDTYDDYVYKNCLEMYKSWIDWVKYYYNHWSGRIIIHTFLIAFLNLPELLWKIFGSVLITLTCMFISKMTQITTIKENNYLIIVTGICFMIIPSLDQTVTWATGSFTFLFPVCAMLIAMYPFFLYANKVESHPIFNLFALVSALISGNMEQTGAVLFLFDIIILCYVSPKEKNNRQRNILAVIWLVNTITFFVSYLAPGNAIRAQGEIMKSSGYSMYSLFDKAILGIQAIFTNLFHFRGLIVWLIPSAVVLAIWIKRKNIKWITVTSINIFLCCIQFLIVRYVVDTNFLNPFKQGYFLWLCFSIFLILYNGFIIMSAIYGTKEYILYWLIYLASLAANWVTCFSPTIFVSARRTTYITYILLIFCSMRLVNEFLNCQTIYNYPSRSKKYAIWGISISLFFIIMMVILFKWSCNKAIIVDANEYTLTENYVITDIEKKQDRVNMTLNVKPFQYTFYNYCTGLMTGYDIDARIGILNNATSKIKLYKTLLISEWPVMISYPKDIVELQSKSKWFSNLSPNQSIVLVTRNHSGEQYYQILDEICYIEK